MIQETVNKWYKHPRILVERACYQMFSKNDEIIYKNKKEYIYTDNFMERYREIEMEISKSMYDDAFDERMHKISCIISIYM